MTLFLCYLVITRADGIPLFAQSFGFNSDEECRSFNDRLTADQNKIVLLGGMFSALQSLAYEIGTDQLKTIILDFETYSVVSIIMNGVLFLGVFETTKKEDTEGDDTFIQYMNIISNNFLKQFAKDKITSVIIDQRDFEHFLENIFELGILTSIEQCRDCISKCKDKNMGCIPHAFYFKEN